MSWQRKSLGVWLGALTTACAPTPQPQASPRPPSPISVAVLPLTIVAADLGNLGQATPLLVTELARSERLRVQAATDQPGPACAEDLECIQGQARRAGAQMAVSGKLAQLGEVLSIRVELIDPQRGTRQKVWQESLQAAGPDELQRSLAKIAAEIRASLAPEPIAKPWYTRFWFWATTGSVAAAATGAVIYAILSGKHDTPPDIHVTPP